MASGSNSAHSNRRRPGKSNSVTALAVPIPTSATPIATLTHSTSEVSAYSGNTVCAICPSTSRDAASHSNHAAPMLSTGSVNSSAHSSNKTGASQRSMGWESGEWRGDALPSGSARDNTNENCSHLE